MALASAPLQQLGQGGESLPKPSTNSNKNESSNIPKIGAEKEPTAEIVEKEKEDDYDIGGIDGTNKEDEVRNLG